MKRFVERWFRHEYFRTFGGWRLLVDVGGCWLFSGLVTPADPYSLFFVFVPLLPLWLGFRYFVARNWAKVDREQVRSL